MGKAGKRKEMVEDRSSEGVLCEKVVCEKGLHYGFEKVCVSSVDMIWWKAECVKEVRLRELRVRDFLVRRLRV